MIKVGVTGGIGSGKTTFIAEWEKLGAAVFNADQQAKRLMTNETELKQKLTQVFGEKAYHQNGELNRKYLAQQAFEKGRVEELNAIVHPAVAEEFDRFCEKAAAKSAKLAVKEAALLLNRGRPEGLDLVILLLAEKKERLRRVSERDALTAAEAESRDRAQPDFEALTHLADYVVYNGGTVSELREKAADLFNKLLEQS